MGIADPSMSAPLWIPDEEQVSATNMAAFHRFVMEKKGVSSTDSNELWRWSVDDQAGFWDAIWDFCRIVGQKGERVIVDKERFPGARYFPDARLNFAENLLRRRDDRLAMVFRGEDLFVIVSNVAQRSWIVPRVSHLSGTVPSVSQLSDVELTCTITFFRTCA